MDAKRFLLLGLLVVSISPSITTSAGLQSVHATPVHTMTSISADQANLIAWGLDLYAAAGLELPGIDFVGYPDRTNCRERSGMHLWHKGRSEIRLCIETISPAHDWLILHELAHVWDWNQLSDDRRQDFLALRGLDEWRNGNWHERGAEHAAEIIVWGLMDRPVRPGHLGSNSSCSDLHTG